MNPVERRSLVLAALRTTIDRQEPGHDEAALRDVVNGLEVGTVALVDIGTIPTQLRTTEDARDDLAAKLSDQAAAIPSATTMVAPCSTIGALLDDLHTLVVAGLTHDTSDEQSVGLFTAFLTRDAQVKAMAKALAAVARVEGDELQPVRDGIRGVLEAIDAVDKTGRDNTEQALRQLRRKTGADGA